MTDVAPRLRILCSGIVVAGGGSIGSAGFEILRELLRRGHEIVFFSKETYVYPESLIKEHGLAYVNCDQPRLDALIARLGAGRLGWIGIKLGNRAYTRRIIRNMARWHREQPYDVEMFLGKWAYGRVPGLPVVSWVQGAPGTDSRSIRRHRPDIIRMCGIGEYALLRAYACYRSSAIGRPKVRHTDVCICGSKASTKTIVALFGLDPSRVKSSAYPIDLELFAPSDSPQPAGDQLELLWVGRVVPRKRLDLFLDAGALLVENGWNVRLTVIGGFPFAAGYRRLIDEFRYAERLTYITQLAHEEVRSRLQSADVLVQPSEDEDFGSSVAEALACGTPVVVGPTNGTADYVGPGGVQFREYTAGAVAAAIACVLYQVGRAPGLVSEETRDVAVARFGVDQVVDGLEAILFSALEDTGKPSRQQAAAVRASV